MTHPLRVAIVGAGPAGIYAADLLIKSAADVSIDLFEQMPAPFGLIRYGVAPDHPRIKGIVKSLHNVLDKPEVRLLANITATSVFPGLILKAPSVRANSWDSTTATPTSHGPGICPRSPWPWWVLGMWVLTLHAFLPKPAMNS